MKETHNPEDNEVIILKYRKGWNPQTISKKFSLPSEDIVQIRRRNKDIFRETEADRICYQLYLHCKKFFRQKENNTRLKCQYAPTKKGEAKGNEKSGGCIRFL